MYVFILNLFEIYLYIFIIVHFMLYLKTSIGLGLHLTVVHKIITFHITRMLCILSRQLYCLNLDYCNLIIVFNCCWMLLTKINTFSRKIRSPKRSLPKRPSTTFGGTSSGAVNLPSYTYKLLPYCLLVLLSVPLFI